MDSFIYLSEEKAYELGVKPDEFWEMTPNDFIKFYKNRIDFLLMQEDNANHRAGVITAMIANVNRSKNSKKFKSSDFFKFNTKKEKKKMTPEQMADHFKMITTALGGKVVK